MFSSHVNIPVGPTSVKGWTVIIHFQESVKRITQLGDLNHEWFDSEKTQLRVFKYGRYISGNWNFNIQGALSKDVQLSPTVRDTQFLHVIFSSRGFPHQGCRFKEGTTH